MLQCFATEQISSKGFFTWSLAGSREKFQRQLRKESNMAAGFKKKEPDPWVESGSKLNRWGEAA